MKKDKRYYFQRAFLLSVPIAVVIIVLDLFEIDLFDINIILKTLLKGMFVGIFTGIILGIIKIFAKVENFSAKTWLPYLNILKFLNQYICK